MRCRGLRQRSFPHDDHCRSVVYAAGNGVHAFKDHHILAGSDALPYVVASIPNGSPLQTDETGIKDPADQSPLHTSHLHAGDGMSERLGETDHGGMAGMASV